MTRLCVLDFETAYSQDYSLSKMSTEEYIRNPMFEVIGLGVKMGDGPTQWYAGTPAVRNYLASVDWSDVLICAHNCAFDGAILSWRFGVRPKGWLDTLSMARALHGVEVGGSLGALAKMYGVGEKGTEVLDAKAKWFNDFTPAELTRYGEYCKNDVDITRRLLDIFLAKGFPQKELALIDLTINMAADPVLRVDVPHLQGHLEDLRLKKKEYLQAAMAATGVTTEAELMAQVQSAEQFANLLRRFDVEPPTKLSKRTGKQSYAFAKTDEEFVALQEHDNPAVQTLVAARLGAKSTLAESRTERFISIGRRGLLPIPLKYYAAHTGRWGGADFVNLQNLPSRGPQAGVIKKAILAPEGYVFIDADSSQIEARCLAWEAEQDDLVAQFKNREDVYSHMATKIYGRTIDRKRKEVLEDGTVVLPDERPGFIGKQTILGCGYGMSGAKFNLSLRQFGVTLPEDETTRIVRVYRDAHPKITRLWRRAGDALDAIVAGKTMEFGRDGFLKVGADGIRLPNGLHIRYPNLRKQINTETLKDEYVYDGRYGVKRIYGAACVENFTQGVARCIIGEQMLRISKRYRVVLTVHDAIGIIAKQEEADEARAYVEACMRWTPAWAEGLPVDCESGVGRSYGDC